MPIFRHRFQLTCLVAALAATVALLPACEESAPSTPTQTVSGSTDTPRGAARLPFAADQLIALGVKPVLVPALRSGQPEAWQGITAGGLDHAAGPNIEQLIAADPDLVIVSAVESRHIPQIEKTTGARVIAMDADTLEDVRTHTRTLGELIGKQAEAEEWIQEFNTDLSGESTSSSADEPFSVLAIFGTPNGFYAFMPHSYLGNLVEHAGGQLITEDMTEHRRFRGLATLSMEVVIDRDPDVLLVIFHGPEESAKAMLDADPLWGQLSATKGDHVAFLSDDLYAMRSGSQATVALEELRAALESAR